MQPHQFTILHYDMMHHSTLYRFRIHDCVIVFLIVWMSEALYSLKSVIEGIPKKKRLWNIAVFFVVVSYCFVVEREVCMRH